MLIRMRKAQSTAEYAIVIGLVIAAAVAMQVYVKRGIQGKVKDATDYVDSDASGVLGKTSQYEPYYMGSEMQAGRQAQSKETTEEGGAVTRTEDETSTRTGTQTIGAAQDQ
jgi:hypothetical protein